MDTASAQRQTITFRVPGAQLERFASLVETLNRRAARVGCEPLVLRETAEEAFVRVRLDPIVLGAPVPGTNPRAPLRYTERDLEHTFLLVETGIAAWPLPLVRCGAEVVRTIEVTGDAPYVAGWRFVASVDHDPAGNVVTSVPGSEPPAGLVERYGTAPADCDHCGAKRARKMTYLLVDAGGAVKQVGSTCLGDFFPADLARKLGALCAIWQALGSEVDPDAEVWGDSGRVGGWLTSDVLAQACAVVRERGFLGKAKASETNREHESTAALVGHELTRAPRSSEKPSFPPTPADREKAAAIVSWVEDEHAGPNDDYLWNLACAVGRPVVTDRLLGLVVSAVAAYDRAALAEAEDGAVVPVPAGRRAVVGTILFARAQDGYRGGTDHKMLLRVEAAGGHYKVWCTCPASVGSAAGWDLPALRGRVVELTVTLEPKDGESGFAFGRRPAKARLVEARLVEALLVEAGEPVGACRALAVDHPRPCAD